MNAAEVEQRVLSEIGDQWGVTNAHHVDLRKCLVKPEKLQFFDDDAQDYVDFWVVLVEDPVHTSGYRIVYDEIRNWFGLAIVDVSGQRFYLGPYGSFWETFQQM